MRNEDKRQLKINVVRLDIAGYNKEQIMNILEAKGFKKPTISKYYEIFAKE